MSLLGYVLLLTAALYCMAAPKPDGSCSRPSKAEGEVLQGDWDDESYPEDKVATYSCQPGFSRQGAIKKICSNGKWDYVGRGQCKRKPCGHPGDIPFGSFELKEGDSFVFGAVVHYTCEEGYQMVSRERTRECTANGWSNYLPHCEVRNCPPVEAAENINVLSTSYDEEYSVGQVVRFECKDPNLKLEGAAEIFCTSEGDWNMEPPKCVDIKCKAPFINNGEVTDPKIGEYKNNEAIQFTCNEGYHPNTNRDIKCTKDDWFPKPDCNEIVCRSDTSVERGYLVATKTLYKFGEEIDVRCDDGYVLQSEPDKRRKCTSNGWFPPARCITKKCDQPDIKNGYIYYGWFANIEKEIEYRCHTNYLSHQRQYWGRIRCNKGGWDIEPKCSRQCPKSKVYFNNADIIDIQSIYLEGEKVKFQCKYDFQTPDGKRNGERTCLPDGEFTPAKCSKTCRAPELLDGKLQTNKHLFELGESLPYECNEGYTTKTKNIAGRIQCLSRGWSEEPKCIPITCPYNDETYNVGEVVKYTCPHGQVPKYETGQCFKYGWGPPPICEDIISTCTIPDTLNLVQSPHLSPYPIGKQVSFSCKKGFGRVGELESSCTKDGWNPPLPTCEEIKCIISDKDNLARQPSKLFYKESDEVSVRCDDNFSKERFTTTICTQNGWNPPLPICKEDRPVEPETTISPTAGKQVQPGDTEQPHEETKNEEKSVQPKATDSSKDNKGEQEEKPVQPEATGSSTDDQGVKDKRKKCPLAYNPVNSEIVDPREEYYSNDTVTMKCVKGYKIRGSGIVRCIEGRWEESPECIKSTPCRNPPRINNGDIIESSIKEKYETDDIVTYSCKLGFHLSGPDQTTCVNEQWTVIPTCTENPCDQPPDVEHAIVVENKETFNHGERAKYECDNGFRFSGGDSASCVRGRWMSTPTCIETSCKPTHVPNAKINGKIKASYASGEKVTYVCNSGYALERSLTGEARCVDTNWHDLPACRRIGEQCGLPPVVQFGDTISIRKLSYKSGEYVEYQCPEYYILRGSKIVSCTNGVWDKAPVCIVPCTANERNMEANNIQFRWKPDDKKIYSKHGDNIEFVCIDGYEAPAGTKLRIACDQGKLDYPKCFKRGFCVLDQSTMIKNNIHYNISTIVEPGSIEFECNEGMIPENSLEAKCFQEKLNYPKCIFAKTCETPKIKNGFIKAEQPSYESGSSVEFECNEGYVINSDINVKCENGQWTELPVCQSPCRISTADLTKRNLQLLSSEDPNSILTPHRHGTLLSVTCKSGFRRPNQAALVIECNDGAFKYTRCFSGNTCRIEQEKLDDNNLELDDSHDNEVFYGESERVRFKCKSGFQSRAKQLTAICTNKKLNYPRCRA